MAFVRWRWGCDGWLGRLVPSQPVHSFMPNATPSALRRSLLLFLLLPNFLFGQEATERHWSLEGSVGAASTYRTLLDNEGSTMSDFLLQNRNDRERPRMGYIGSIAIARRLGSHWKLSIGLSYGRYGYIYEHANNSWVATDGVMADPVLNFPSTFRSIDEFRYLGLPIGIERSFGKGRFRPVLRCDVAPAWMSSAKYIVTNEYSDGRSKRTIYDYPSEMKENNLFTSFHSGCTYRLNERLHLALLPYGSIGVLEIIDAPVTARLWSLGVMSGVRWDL